MTESTHSGSARKWTIVAVVVALILVALLVTCRSKTSPAPKETPRTAEGLPAPVLPPLREGLEWVRPEPGASLVTIRDRATGETVELNAADSTPEKIEAAFALKAKAHAVAPPPPNEPAPTPVATTGSSTFPLPPPPPLSTTGPGATLVAAPADPAPKGPDSTGLPAFVPLYPGATTLKLSALSEQESAHGNYAFTTADPPGVVGKFYADKVTALALTVLVNVAGAHDGGATYTLIAEDGATRRSLSLTVAVVDGKTRGAIEFAGK